MAWKDNLNNITAPNIDTTQFTREDLPNYIIEKNKETSGGWWLNFTTIAFFLFSIFSFAKKNGLSQAIIISSYCSLMIALSFILIGWSVIIYPFFLFGLIWAVSVIWVYNSKENNKI